MEKTDRRVLKTRQAIEEAFERLIADTDYDKITVSAIAREANINRKTFYLHYDSVDDLIDSLAKSYAEMTVQHAIDEGLLDKHPLDIAEISKFLGERYREARLLNPLFVRKLPTSHLIDAMQGPLEKLIAEERKAVGLKPIENLGYAVGLFLAGIFKVYESWYNSCDDVQFEKITRLVWFTLARGLDGILSEEIDENPQ